MENKFDPRLADLMEKLFGISKITDPKEIKAIAEFIRENKETFQKLLDLTFKTTA